MPIEKIAILDDDLWNCWFTCIFVYTPSPCIIVMNDFIVYGFHILKVYFYLEKSLLFRQKTTCNDEAYCKLLMCAVQIQLLYIYTYLHVNYGKRYIFLSRSILNQSKCNSRFMLNLEIIIIFAVNNAFGIVLF